MSWISLSDSREVSPHRTSLQELSNLRALILRDLADAAIPALSADRRFATAYNAALQASTMAIACCGYRVTARAGHHAVAFEAVKLAVGNSVDALADYFDTCRRKRNTIDYHNTSVATETEAQELLQTARQFHAIVEAWIATQYPSLTPQQRP